ncbi:MAG: apolipoprotein N-acyltransferase [Magnetococcales bacterium]|nr:apolipoprotein N-acyltransferase [Magnetococcales bacterium]
MADYSLSTLVARLKTALIFLKDRERIPAYLCVIAGMVSVRGLPPIQEELTMMVGFGTFFILLFGTTVRRGAWLGFLFGLGHFTLSFSWLVTSIHTHGGFPLPLALLALLIFSAVISLYSALFGALLPRIAPRAEILPLAAPALWVVTEWLRVRLFTGFAWNLTGYGWNGRDYLVQVADLGGIYLLSWLMLFPAAILALLWIHHKEIKRVALGCGSILVVLGLANLYGYIRLDANTESANWAPPLKVALIQGNIPQEKKWDPRFKREGFSRYIDLSRSLSEPVDLVVWPETAVAFFLQGSPKAMEEISQLSQHLGAPLLTGGPMADKEQDGSWLFYNSAILLDESGNQDRRYNKHHLVPFGEYIPFREYMPDSITKVTEGTSDFTPGPGPVPLAWGQGAIGMLICYEVIFPHEVRQLATTGVRWLINITNDAWFGEAAKPQHLAMARMRTIENRLPLVRVANTGISAAFDQYGQELGRIEANQKGVLTVALPRGHGQSLFRRMGHIWIWFWLYLCGAAWIVGIWQTGMFRSLK